MKFKTYNEAQQETMELEEAKARETFCPLTKAFCRTDCESFEYIKITRVGKHYEIPEEPSFGCSAYILKGGK